MAEPLKNLFHPQMVETIGRHIARQHPSFPVKQFAAEAVANFDGLEFKARSNAISLALDRNLPEEFSAASKVLVAALHPETDAELNAMQLDDRGIRGWGVLPLTEFVARRGLDDFDIGMAAQKAFTQRLTAEFGIRPFILNDAERALGHFKAWATDPNFHVRRLVSEGSRPYLPWGLRLHDFAKDPSPILPLLTQLRDDPHAYVRRSVANSLNDISKDHPDLIADLARDWLKTASPERRQLVKYALRGLIKSGHAGALSVLGFGPAEIRCENLLIATPEVTLGTALEFSCELISTATAPQNIVLDFAIHHQKANGTTRAKMFKWCVMALASGERRRLQRRHPMRPITTRTYYQGAHQLEIFANGTSIGRDEFMLKLA